MGKRKPDKQLGVDDLIFPKGSTLEADLLRKLEFVPEGSREAARIVFDVFPGPQVIETRKGPDHPCRDAEGNVADESEVSI